MKPAALLIAFFVADVTPPIGHPLCGGLVPPARRIVDPLHACGVVLKVQDRPIVLCVVDWCEIHSDAHDRWRRVLAEAAGTTPERVMVSAIHQHDTPIADLEARHELEARGVKGTLTEPAFHERAVQRAAAALRKALRNPQPVTHIGLGQAKVEKIASNRRILQADGKVHKMRGSSCTDPDLIAAPEGTIDPYLKTISLWNGDKPVVALSCYATHPMSYYRTGGVSCDFYGLARERRQKDDPSVGQIIANGCQGNIGAGKYNDGSPKMRRVLTQRLYDGMVRAWKDTKRMPIEKVAFRSVPLELPLKKDPAFSLGRFQKVLDDPKKASKEKVRAALAVNWINRTLSGETLDVPVIDFGVAQILLTPGEAFVEYQLLAQKLRPDAFVMTIGLGDVGPGYIPTDEAYDQGGYEVGPWSFVGPGSEKAMTEAIRAALLPKPTR